MRRWSMGRRGRWAEYMGGEFQPWNVWLIIFIFVYVDTTCILHFNLELTS